ncbi:MAG: hypothetical protein IT186_26745 [Acidobacteria bacterium]|nr:hypothetical protein [Acidobacteriota bacterium]
MVTLILLAQIATATPAPRPAAVASPSPAVRPRPVVAVPRGGTSLSDIARGRKIDPKAFATPPARAEEGTTTANAGASTSSSLESMSEDERLWRGKAEKIHREIAEARSEAEEEKSRTMLPTPGMRDPQLELLRDAAAEKELRKIEKLEKQLARLTEECRKTPGCQPGWVR